MFFSIERIDEQRHHLVGALSREPMRLGGKDPHSDVSMANEIIQVHRIDGVLFSDIAQQVRSLNLIVVLFGIQAALADLQCFAGRITKFHHVRQKTHANENAAVLLRKSLQGAQRSCLFLICEWQLNKKIAGFEKNLLSSIDPLAAIATIAAPEV